MKTKILADSQICISLPLRSESHIDFRTQRVIMKLTGGGRGEGVVIANDILKMNVEFQSL